MNHFEMYNSWSMHELRDKIDIVRDIRSCEC
jgi:hypothetical protein